MRLIDADELIEHAWRDRLDSRERIVEMIENAPTIKEIPTKIPIDIFEQLVSQEPKMGHWRHYEGMLYCSKCGAEFYDEIMEYTGDEVPKRCPDCGAKMAESEDKG